MGGSLGSCVYMGSCGRLSAADEGYGRHLVLSSRFLRR